MKFTLRKASEQWLYNEPEEKTIELKTLKELLDLIKKEGSIIMDDESITIYDDYLE